MTSEAKATAFESDGSVANAPRQTALRHSVVSAARVVSSAGKELSMRNSCRATSRALAKVVSMENTSRITFCGFTESQPGKNARKRFVPVEELRANRACAGPSNAG